MMTIMNETRTIFDITYTWQRRRRKTSSVIVERDGTVIVVTPEDCTPDQADGVVRSKQGWIYRKLTEHEVANESRIDRDFVGGETFPYLGRNYRLFLVEDQDQDLKLKHGTFCLRKKDLYRARDAFKRFYKTRGRDKIMQRVQYYAPFLKKQPSNVTIKDLGNRWGSCSEKGNVFFHWKVTLAPMQIVDYIVVHELCHLEHPNHSTSFWDEVYRILPDYEERKQWLDKNGASLDI